MRYFLLRQDMGYANIPRPVNWFDKLIPGKAMESLRRIPDREVFRVKTGEQTVFIDFMADPFAMVSEKAKKCFSLFEPNMPFKEIVLLDKEKREAQNYFVPFFTELCCLTENSRYTNWNYDLNYIELDESKIRDKAVFILKGPKKQNIIIRLDAVESLLRREAEGFTLKEVEVR